LFHRIEEALNLKALVRSQLEPIAELKDVARTGKSIGLGGERQPHAASGAQIVDLLMG
jgi:hypothetical protein